MENAKAKGKQIGRKPTTKDDIPATFYKHYPAFAAGTLNVSELARVCGLSIMSSKHVLSHCLQIRPLIEYIQEHQISRKTLPTSGGLPLSHQSQILIHRGPTQSAYPRQFADVQLTGDVCGIMLIEDDGNFFLCCQGSADVLALGGGVCHSRPGEHPQDGAFQYCEYGGNLDESLARTRRMERSSSANTAGIWMKACGLGSIRPSRKSTVMLPRRTRRMRNPLRPSALGPSAAKFRKTCMKMWN